MLHLNLFESLLVGMVIYKFFLTKFHLLKALHSPAMAPERFLMTLKYRGSIIVLSISKSVEPNGEKKEMTSSFQ